jgi:Cys-tRNA(Pro) deacylase
VKAPSTAAVRLLRERGVPFTEHLYRYQEHGGTGLSSRALGLPEHAIVKTLVLEDDLGQPLLVLMHGDRELSLKALARQLGRRSVQLCHPEAASRHTGYLLGGTSPFATRKPLPVFVERTVLELPRVFVNGGSRGFLVGLAPAGLLRVLNPTPVSAALT